MKQPLPTPADAARLSPYVRSAHAEWRGPWHIPSRYLLDYLVFYVREGKGRCVAGEQAFEYAAGDVVWIPPGVRHELSGYPPRMHVLYAHFDFQYREGISEKISRFGVADLAEHRRLMHPACPLAALRGRCGRLPLANAQAVHALLQQMCLEFAGRRDALRCAGMLMQMLGEIVCGLSPGMSEAGAHWPALQKAAEAILNRAHEPLDVPALAQAAKLSSSHFRLLFRAAHGMSPRRWHKRARVHKACEMIIQSGWNLTRISRELGFSTVHNLSRCFKREMGVSPREYRRRMAAGVAARQT
ncbi:MAG TPA: helix-turn-helix domain-containing protein [Planctomycetota bacterium]|nr:helix-turn-helix domain-containing protein [Planctomycetota bacterium]